MIENLAPITMSGLRLGNEMPKKGLRYVQLFLVWINFRQNLPFDS